MARRRYQNPEPEREVLGKGKTRAEYWTIRWREDVLVDGVLSRRTKKTRLGLVGYTAQDEKDGKLTKRLAYRERDALLAKTNGFAYKPTATLTFGELARRWREKIYPQLEPSTQNQQRWHVDRFLLPFFEAYNLEAVTQEAVQGFVASVVDETTPAVIRTIIGTLQGIFKVGRGWHYPCPPILRKGLTMGTHIPKGEFLKFFSIEEAMQVCEQAGPYYGMLFRVQMALGLRPCEVLGLTLDDFDFATRRVLVRKKAWGKHLRPTKAKRIKIVSLSVELEEALQRFLQTDWIPNEQNLLFCNPSKKTAVYQKWLRARFLTPLLERMGFPKRGLHAFRHTAASTLFSGGVPTLAVGSMLGHSPKSDITLLYGHILGDDAAQAATMLSAMAFGMSKKASTSAGRTDDENVGSLRTDVYGRKRKVLTA